MTYFVNGGGLGQVGGNGIAEWNPTTDPNRVQSGKAGGMYIIVGGATITIIDNIPAGTISGTIIYFDSTQQKWNIASKSDTQTFNKGLCDTPIALETQYPATLQEVNSYALVKSTATFWFVAVVNDVKIWQNSGLNVSPDSLKIYNNLSDVLDKDAARANIEAEKKDATILKQAHIINDLTSTSTIQPLSANQGKALDEKKVDKVAGKDLSTNDFTNIYKSQLDNAPANINTSLAGKVDKINITGGTVGGASKTITATINTQGQTTAFSEQNISIPSTQITDFVEASQDAIGNTLLDTETIDLTYNDVNNTISADVKPNSLSDVQVTSLSGSKIIQDASNRLVSDIEKTTWNAKQNALGFTPENVANKVTTFSATPTDTNYITEKLAKTSIDNLQNQINSRPVSASDGNTLSFTSQNGTGITGYSFISYSPDTNAESLQTITISSTTPKASRLIRSYIADHTIGKTVIDSGRWGINLYGYSSNTDVSSFEIEVFKRDTGGTETSLFLVETGKLTQTAKVSTSLNQAIAETTQQTSFACNETDKIVIKVYGKTTRTSNTDITFIQGGSEYASHIHSPLVLTHNQTAGLQGGSATERYHLTQAEYSYIQNLSSTFDGKKDKITPITPTTKGSASKTTTTTVSAQGDVLSIVEQDIAIPSTQITDFNTAIGTATQNAINQKQNTSEKGQPNGYVPLDSLGYIDNQFLNPSAKIIQVSVANQTARFALTTTQVQYLDQVYQEDTQITYQVIDQTKLNQEAGYRVLAGSLNWSQIQNKPTDIFYKTTDTTDNITQGTAKFTTASDIARLANTSGTNTGDETGASIQAKRPLKTISSKSLEGTGDVVLTKSDVGLGNVDNTSDINKPISTAVQTALNLKEDAFSKNTAFNKNFGNTSNTVAQGNDGRLGTKNIDETNIGNNRIQVYNSTTGNLEYQDKEKNVKQWYLSGGITGTGSDSNNGYTQNSAFLTLAYALTKLGNTGEQLIQLPTLITESAEFTQYNIEVTGSHASHRGFCGTSGTYTSKQNDAGSQTFQHLSIASFVKAPPATGNAGYTMLRDLNITTSYSDSAGATMDNHNITFNDTTPITINGSGVKNFYNQRGGIFTINNSSANVNVVTPDKISQFTLAAGTLSIRNAIVYVAQGTTFTIGASGSTFFADNVRFIYPDGTKAKINIPSGVNYSIQNNCIYDSANSTFNGTDISGLYQGNYGNIAVKTLNLPSATASRIAGIDASKNVISLDTATYPNLTEVGYVKGVTSAIQTQLNGKEATITTLPIAKGGTNSSTALSNNKVIISSADKIVEGSITTTELQTLATGSTLSKLASNTVTSSDNGKIPQVDASGNIAFITPASGGNVSATGLSGIPIGDIALFNLPNGTGLTKVDGTATQRAVATNSLQIPARFTNAELNAGTFSTGAIHLNSDYGYLAEKGASSWSNMLSSPQSISTTAQTISNKARVVEITPNAESASFITYLPNPSSLLNTVLHIKLAKTLSRLYYGVTLTPTTGTIDGGSSFTLSGPYDFVTLQAVSGDWVVVNKPTGLLKIGSVTTTGMTNGSQCNFDYGMSTKYAGHRFKIVNTVGTSSGTYTNAIKFRSNGVNDAETGNYQTLARITTNVALATGDSTPALSNQWLGGSVSAGEYAGNGENRSIIVFDLWNARQATPKYLMNFHIGYMKNGSNFTANGGGFNSSTSSFDGICVIQNGGSNATTTIEAWAILN
jgi:hypothetical protein